MKITLCVAILGLLSLTVVCTAAQEISKDLVKNKKIEILFSGNARKAAEFLRKNIADIIGATPAFNKYSNQMVAKKDDKITFYIGRTKLTDSLYANRLNKLDRDGFIAVIDKNAIYLCGKEQWGDLQAVRFFLEKQCDVRFCMPGKLGTVLPARKNILLKPMDVAIEPDYKSRQFSGYRGRAASDWLNLMGQRARYKFHHSFASTLKASKYGKSDPDIFPLIKGRRKIPKKDRYACGVQLCLTNPKTIRLFAEACKDKKYAAVSPNDGGGFCECKKCAALRDNSSKSNNCNITRSKYVRLVWGFVNAVAKQCPDTLIGCNAYGYHLEPVPGLKLEPNVIPYIVGPRDMVKGIQEMHGVIDMWKKAGAQHLGIYEWYFGGGYFIPRIYNKQIAKSLRNGYKKGADGLYSEIYPNWGLDAPKYYLMMKLMWNSSLDVDATMDEYYAKFFGSASKPMADYFKTVEQIWHKKCLTTGKDKGNERTAPKQFRHFTPQIHKRLNQLFITAKQMAKTKKVKARIKYFYLAYKVFRDFCLQYAACQKVEKYLNNEKTLWKALSILKKFAGSDAVIDENINIGQKQVPVAFNFCTTGRKGKKNRLRSAFIKIKNKVSKLILLKAKKRAKKSGKTTTKAMSKIIDNELKALLPRKDRKSVKFRKELKKNIEEMEAM